MGRQIKYRSIGHQLIITVIKSWNITLIQMMIYYTLNTVKRVTYTDEYRACIWTSGMSLYTSPY